MSEKIYLDGHMVSKGEARIAVSNPAFLHGVGLFETLRTYAGEPFRLAEHVERLRRSAEHFDMPVADALERIPSAVEQVLTANNLSDARVRITVTPPGSVEAPEEVTLLVRAEDTKGYPLALYEKGMTICLLDQYRQSSRDPLAGHKTTSYFPRLLALRDAQEKRCGEGLWFTPENLLAEGCMTNVFLVRSGRLLTPPVDTPVLPGVTRAAVIELADRQGIPCDQRPCTVDELLKAEEIFLTNAVMEIMPVTQVERHAIGDQKIGPLTRLLAEAFKRLTVENTS